jgi:hypothetical protein
LHEQIAAIRERRSQLQTALAQVHGARSGEPHPLLVSLDALGGSDGEDNDEEEDIVELDVRAEALSLEQTEDGSMQYFGPGPSPLARRAPAPTLTATSIIVRQAVFYIVFKNLLGTL